MTNRYFNWPESPNRFVRFDSARAEDLNDALDGVSASMDAIDTDVSRSIKMPPGDGDQSITLSAAQRAGTFLGFDANGNLTAAPAGGRFRGYWAPGTTYLAGDTVRLPSDGSIYATTQQHSSAASPSIDISAGRLLLVIDVAGVSTTALAFGASVSSSELTIGTGEKFLVVEQGKGFLQGMAVIISDKINPSIRMYATVDTYDPTTGVLGVTAYDVVGSGSGSLWSVVIIPAQLVTLSGTQELSGKTIDLSFNQLRMTSAQFLLSLSDGTGTGRAVFSHSPEFSGNPTAPTQSEQSDSESIATTAFVSRGRVAGITYQEAKENISARSVVGIGSDGGILSFKNNAVGSVGSEQILETTNSTTTRIVEIPGTSKLLAFGDFGVRIYAIDASTGLLSATGTNAFSPAASKDGFDVCWHPSGVFVVATWVSDTVTISTINVTGASPVITSVTGTFSAYGTKFQPALSYNSNQGVLLLGILAPTTGDVVFYAGTLSGSSITWSPGSVGVASALAEKCVSASEIFGTRNMLVVIPNRSGGSSPRAAVLTLNGMSAPTIGAMSELTGLSFAKSWRKIVADIQSGFFLLSNGGVSYAVLSVSNGSVVVGSIGSFAEQLPSSEVDICADGLGRFFVFGRNSVTSKGECVVYKSGESLVAQTSFSVAPKNIAYPAVAYMTGFGAAVFFYYGSFSSSTYILGKLYSEQYSEYSQIAQWIGVARDDIGIGERGPVVISGGICDGFRGLIPGMVYCVNLLGEITPLETAVKIGRAISSSELMVLPWSPPSS